MNMLLIAALLCPTAGQVKTLEVFELVVDCQMPLAAGWVMTPAAYKKNAARIAGLDTALDKRTDRLKEVRLKRDELSTGLVASSKTNLALTERLTEQLKSDTDPPSRLSWALVGIGGTVLAIAAGALVYVSQDDG